MSGGRGARSPVERLVLDVHGVVLNNPFGGFLDGLAAATGIPPGVVRRRWREEVHDGAWLGQLGDEEIWRRLSAGLLGAAECATDLERCYVRGPAAGHLARWRERVPIWLLSNHRARWLRPRLERLGVARHIERVLVSDELGAMKPAPQAFAEVLGSVSRPTAAVFVDDQRHNVEAARALGMRAVHADPRRDWPSEVTRALDGTSARSLITE